MNPRWFATRSAAGVVIVALALVVFGIAAARPMAVALAAGVLLSAALGRDRRPGRPGRAPTLHLGLTTDAAGSVEPMEAGPARSGHAEAGPTVDGRHVSTLEIPEGEVRLRASLPGYREARALVGPGSWPVAFTSARTGRLAPLRVDWVPVGGDGGWEGEQGTLHTPPLVVEPRPRDPGPLRVPRHLVGLTGTHRSRRRGEGDDLHDIAPFAPGDRLRGVDWRVTARRGTTDPRMGTQLYVRRRLADAEAVVMVVLDSRDDVGIDVRTWAGGTAVLPTEPTSLDVARQAAVSYARGYLEQGDRVGFTDLAVRRRPVRPGAGRRHLARITAAVTASAPVGEPAPLVRPPQVSSGAGVVVVSTFLDVDAAAAAHGWLELGHPVTAVDVLPSPHLGRLSAAELVAARVVLLERAARMIALRRAGAEVVRWWL